MAKEKISGIYCIENIVNHKKYIGQSCNIFQRFRCHKCDLRKNKHSNIHLQAAWNKYGSENFKFYILVTCNIKDLDNLEKQYISLYDTYKNGYNRDLGGKREGHKSKETINKLKKSRQNLSNEVRENMREAQFSIPILQIDFNGNIINNWSGSREASKKLKYNQSCIWNCVNHKRKTYKNYIWISKEEYFKDFSLDSYVPKTHPKPIKVIQLDQNNNVIKVWNSIREIKRIAKIDESGVIDCCKRRRNLCKGFQWFYYKDYLNRVNNFDINA